MAVIVGTEVMGLMVVTTVRRMTGMKNGRGNLQTLVPAIIIINNHLERRHIMLNIKIVTWSLGIFTAVSFIVCVIYGLVTPESIHMHTFLESVLPAFKWLNFGGFILGLVESFLYGVYAGLVYVPIYNFFYKRWHK